MLVAALSKKPFVPSPANFVNILVVETSINVNAHTKETNDVIAQTMQSVSAKTNRKLKLWIRDSTTINDMCEQVFSLLLHKTCFGQTNVVVLEFPHLLSYPCKKKLIEFAQNKIYSKKRRSLLILKRDPSVYDKTLNHMYFCAKRSNMDMLIPNIDF